MIDKYTKKILTNNDKYVIFYSEWCGYSMKAVKLLENNKLQFKGYKIDKIKGDIDTLVSNLKLTSNLTNFNKKHRTRPIIFKNGKFLGGYTELQNHVKSISVD